MKPVVFVPGFPASDLWLVDSADHTKRIRRIFPPRLGDLTDKERKARLIDYLSLPDALAEPVEAGDPIGDVLQISKQAESLYDILRLYHYSIATGDHFRAVGWDWRYGIDHFHVQNALKAAIDDLAARHHRPVVVICHSTGGLVLRRLLETEAGLAARIDQILAFGVPWAGTLKALRYVAKGEAFGFLHAKLKAHEVRRIMLRCQAAWDLLPPDPAKTPMTTEKGVALDIVVDHDKHQVGPAVDLRWLPKSSDYDFARDNARMADDRLGARAPQIVMADGVALPMVTNVVGWGAETDTTFHLTSDGAFDFSKTSVTHQGDGTVPAISASWLRGSSVRTYFVPIGAYPLSGVPRRHSRLWDAPPLLELFDQVLLDKPAEPFVCAAADGDDMADRLRDCTVRLTAAGLRGEPLPGAEARIRLNGKTTRVPFGTSQRAEVEISRAGLDPNAGGDFYRFLISISWAGGERELPVVIRV